MRCYMAFRALVGIASLLLSSPHIANAEKGSLRSSDHATDMAVIETLKSLSRQVSSFQSDQQVLMDRISELEKERDELRQRVTDLEASDLKSDSNEQRRLQESCIIEDSRQTGRLVIANCNLYVQSGGGRSDATNGRGNLIIGYNELENHNTDRRGSHNLVIGVGHQYTSHSGFVAGRSNSLNNAYASIAGGHHNSADASCSTVGGGQGNVVRGDASHVSGGAHNVAAASDTAILGGTGMTAYEWGTTVPHM